MNRDDWTGVLTAGLVLAVVLGGALFLEATGVDALEGFNDWQFFADSPTYHQFLRELGQGGSWREAIGVGANYLGPLLLLGLVGDNYYAVLLLNAALLYFSVLALARATGCNAFLLALVLLLNPLTISSVLSVNKEILSLVFLALLLNAYRSGSVLLLVAALATSLLVRWQMTLFALVLVASMGFWGPNTARRGWFLAALLVGISLVYVFAGAVLGEVQENFEMAAADYNGSGLYALLVRAQQDGWYWAVFPAKALYLLYALGLRVDRLLRPDDIYNDIWQLLHSSAMLLLTLAAGLRGRLALRDDHVFVALVYLAVFALTPIYAPRYFYPVYVLLAVALLRPDPPTAGALPAAAFKPS